jgi:hypothetical protein
MQAVSSRRRLSSGQDSQERADDGQANLSLPQDFTADTLSASSLPTYPRIQARQRMAIRPFGSRTVDSRRSSQTSGQFLD